MSKSIIRCGICDIDFKTGEELREHLKSDAHTELLRDPARLGTAAIFKSQSFKRNKVALATVEGVCIVDAEKGEHLLELLEWLKDRRKEFKSRLHSLYPDHMHKQLLETYDKVGNQIKEIVQEHFAEMRDREIEK